MEHLRVTIAGLENNETKERVRGQLENMIGIGDVDLSTGQNYVDISYDDRVSVAEINSHLQNNGYKILDGNNEF